MTQEELDKIVEQHKHWIKQDCKGWGGMSANLRRADLRKANLNDVDLREADLSEADLSEANLYGSNLYRVNLRGANLRRAALHGANLRWANLRKANLREANLSEADLRWADLRGADLRGAKLNVANLREADLSEADFSEANFNEANLYGTHLSVDNRFRLGQILTNPLTGYKKTKEGVVITAEIPSGAIVFCINGSKCRTNRAKITDMAGHDVLHSQYDNRFEYRFGKEIEIKDFNLIYNVECTNGFHFFRTRKEAEKYE